MKNPRRVVIDGKKLTVPPRIQRIDSRYGVGWQVRYQGTAFFSDAQSGDDPRLSLQAAIDELHNRYALIEPKVASSLREAPLPHKTSTLPAGISGPVLIKRPGRMPYAEFKVSLPRAGKRNSGTTVYIASERTWSPDRYYAALSKAIAWREAAVTRFREARP